MVCHYWTIVIDPPWPSPSAPTFRRRGTSAFLPYESMTGNQIAALRIEGLAADDARLFLWSPSRNLGDAYLLIQTWGFRWRGLFIWRKPLGLGRFVRTEAEFLIYAAKRGTPAELGTGGLRQIHAWPKPRRHSEKPKEAYDLIARLSPAPRIDLFARQKRPGFDAWGREVECLLR